MLFMIIMEMENNISACEVGGEEFDFSNYRFKSRDNEKF